jgi:hypothetical protein
LSLILQQCKRKSTLRCFCFIRQAADPSVS